MLRTHSEVLDCGHNAVYMVLKLLGHEVRYSDITGNIGEKDEGTSLLEVKNEFQRFGLAAEVIKCQPSDLPQIQTPYILYNNPTKPGNLGSFYVVVSADSKNLKVLDANSGLEKTFNLGRIVTNLREERYYHGDIYVIAVQRERSFLLEIVLLILSIAFFALHFKVIPQ